MPTPPAAPSRRADIDGLRAVAVLLVLLCHLGIRPFGGGFIGVDVFFTVSGYLLGGIILRALESGSFSFVDFYERRVRRIAPALLATLVATIFLAWHFLFPPELNDFAHSLLPSLFSFSNIFFLHNSGYFDLSNQIQPLLHTWSLAVEEQFYFVLPILLLVLFRVWRRGLTMMLCLFASASLALAWLTIAAPHDDAPAAFFLFPHRAWELLLGVILCRLPELTGRVQREAVALAGLLSILACGSFYTAQTSFPGPAALPPCLGAALLLAANQHGPTVIGRLLSWRPVAFVGLISYSLYLVHWPLLVFQRDTQFLVDEARHPHLVAPVLLLVSLLLATLMWRFVETPFRRGRLRPRRGVLFAITSGAVAGLSGIAIVLLHFEGGPVPHIGPNAEARRYLAFRLYGNPQHPGNCFAMDHFQEFTPAQCLAESPGRLHYLLIGDSHAAVLWAGLSQAFPEIDFAEATMAGCRPLTRPYSGMKPECIRMNDFMLKEYLPHHHFDRILVSARWRKGIDSNLAETIAWLRGLGLDPVVLGPSIEYDFSLPRLVAISQRTRNPGIFTPHRAMSHAELDLHFSQLAQAVWHVSYISMYQDLCDPAAVEKAAPWQVRTAGGCPVYAAPGIPLLKDDNHIGKQGALWFAQTIRARGQIAVP